jgi:hydrogenase maturation protease
MANRTVVIGVGNEYRRDDGFGPRVIAELIARSRDDDRLAGVDLRVSDGEPSRMLQAWAGADLAVVVDVTPGDGSTGWCEVALPSGVEAARTASSGHRVELGTTIAFARALDRLPGRLVALVAYGHEFGLGAGLSDDVTAAVGPVADRACALAASS